MSVVPTIAGAQTRLALLRSRVNGVAAATSDDPAADAPAFGRGPGFDPFGAAYQQAVSTVAATRSAPTAGSQAGTGTTGAMPTSSASFDPMAAVQAPNLLTAQRVRHSAAATSTESAGTGSTGSVNSVAAGSSRSGSSLSGEQIAQMAYNAGFRGDDLVSVVAISKRESGWKPTAFNGNRATGDVSYGLMQINMIGDMGPARLAQFGIDSPDQLFDPQTNLNAAYTLYTRSGNTLRAWGGYKGLSNTFSTNMAEAQQVVESAGLAGL